jgi:hypothetical protein
MVVEWQAAMEALILVATSGGPDDVRTHRHHASVEPPRIGRLLRHRLPERHPALHIWGYTARWDIENDPIAAALVALAQQYPDRFAMRFSNAPAPFAVPTTISVEHPFQVPDDATLCPQEVDRTESCSTCALCWHSKERIAFIQH